MKKAGRFCFFALKNRQPRLQIFYTFIRLNTANTSYTMPTTLTIKDIRSLIGKGKLEQAIEAMLLLAEKLNDRYFSESIILQSSRWHSNDNKKNEGTLSTEVYDRTNAQITKALLDALNDLGENSTTIEMDLPASAPSPTPVPTAPDTPNDGKTTILMLASNPSGTSQLQLKEEHSSISRKIQESDNADAFRIRFKQAVTLSEFQEYLLDETPGIVHFSGHGEKGNPEVENIIRRGLNLGGSEVETPKEDTGIILYDEDKRDPFFVGTVVVESIFDTIVNEEDIPIQAVIFNACYSEGQAVAIAKIVPYVIGTNWSVNDNAAIAFATGFYGRIARGKDIKSAFRFGVNQAMAYGEPKDRFVLYENGKKFVW